MSCRGRTTWLRASVVAIVVMLIAVASGNAPASAQSAVVTLVAISPHVQGNEPLRIELRASGAAPTDRVRIAILTRETRARVRKIIDGSAQPTRADYTPIDKPVSEVLDASRQTLVVNVANSQLPQTPGVYPLNITVGTAAAIRTWLVRVSAPAAGDVPYSVSLVVPVTSATADQPDGSTRLAPKDVARMDAIATLLNPGSSGLTPGSLTFVPNPETLDALDASPPEARAVLEHLQATTREQLVLASPFVPIDIDAWRRAGQDDHVTLQLRYGRDTLARTLGRSSTDISSRTAVLAPHDSPASIDALRREGATNLIVPDTMLEPLRADAFPSPFAQTFRVRDSTGQDLLAASTDSWLSNTIAELSRTTDPVNRTQHLFADLAAGYLDRPKVARGSVVLLPTDWTPTQRIIDLLVKPLHASPILRLRSTDGFFATVTRSNPATEDEFETLLSGPLRRTILTTRGSDVDVAPLNDTRSAIESYRALFGAVATKDIERFEESLLALADVRLTSDQRRSYVDAIRTTITDSLKVPNGTAAVSVPASELITLTSQRETIRLVITNQLTVPVQTRIDLRSEKLSFPNGESVTTVLQPGTNTISLEVNAKATGDSLLEYTVNAPSGSLGELAKGKLQIRYIRLTGVGMVLSILAMLVLLTWWIRHGVKSRRVRHLAAMTP